MRSVSKRVLPILSIVGIIVLVKFLSPAINRQLHSWRVLPEPERITELYFTEHTKLPTIYSPGSRQVIAFTTHNLEYRPTNYSYTVTQSSQDGSQTGVVGSGSFSLGTYQFLTTSSPITLLDYGARSKITIRLSTNESINFWVKKESV